MDDYDRAIEDFDASIKLDPDYASAFANRAQTYLNKSEYVRAVQDYGEAIRPKACVGSRVERTLLDPRHSRRITGCAGGLQRGASAEAGRRRHVGLARVDLPEDGPMGFGHRRL